MLFYIRIELDRSNVDGRSFQASTDKMLYFQGLYGFRRDSPAFLNDCKAIENTGQTDFFGISDDSSQIVVTVISLPEQHFRKNIKTRCLQNYKQRVFICRSIIKIVSKRRPEENGTGAGLRAKLARSKAKEMRPHSKTLCRRMKLHYHNCTDILYLHSQTVPEGELRFF